jgi:hypothetical protein
LLVAVGIPIRLALGAASVAWIVLVGVGTWLGIRLRDRFGDRAFLILTPLAVSLIGAPFEHGHQLAAALPALLLFFARRARNGWIRAGALIATIGFAIPWETIAESSIIADRHAFRPVPAFSDRAHPDYETAIEIPYTAYMDAYAQAADQRSLGEQMLWKIPTWISMIGLFVVTMRAALRPTPDGFDERERTRT